MGCWRHHYAFLGSFYPFFNVLRILCTLPGGLPRLYNLCLFKISDECASQMKVYCWNYKYRLFTHIFRIFIVIYMFIFINTCLIDPTQDFDLLFYTNQSYVIVLFYFLLSSCVCHRYEQNPTFGEYTSQESKCPTKSSSNFYKFIYILFIVGLVNSLIAAVVFWGVLFYDDGTFPKWKIVWFGFNPHGLSFIFCFIDMVFFNNFKLELRNFVYLYIYMIYYTLLGIVDYAFNGSFMYSIFNFSEPYSFVYWIIIYLAPFIIFFLFYLMVLCRDKMRNYVEGYIPLD